MKLVIKHLVKIIKNAMKMVMNLNIEKCVIYKNKQLCICKNEFIINRCKPITCDIINPCNSNGKWNIYKGKCIDYKNISRIDCECYAGWKGKNCSEAYCDDEKICAGKGLHFYKLRKMCIRK